jgi:hypothetical protein
MLTIATTEQSFQLDARNCIALELKLNVTSKGNIWSAIGDHLFNYGMNRPCKDTLVVTHEQYAFLEELQTRASYKDCRTL